MAMVVVVVPGPFSQMQESCTVKGEGVAVRMELGRLNGDKEQR